MKRLLAGISLALLVIVGLPQSAWAHELQQNNGVSAVLHIVPDDNPVAAEDTYLEFEFSSQNAGFDLATCQCTVSFQAAPNQLQTAKIFNHDNSPVSGHAVINFPQAGVYTLQVQGYTSAALTEHFKLSYIERVAPGGDDAVSISSAKSIEIGIFSLASLGLLAVVASEMIRRGGRYRQVTPGVQQSSASRTGKAVVKSRGVTTKQANDRSKPSGHQTANRATLKTKKG